MKHLPSLKQLEYLLTLSETLNFARAAQQCFVTPSTLSAGIKELETTLGVTLAERNNRQVIMTPVGELIAAKARALLRDAGELVDLAVAHQTPLTGEVRLGVIPTVSPFLMPRVLPEIIAAFPALQPSLVEQQTHRLLEQVRSGDLDVAIVALPCDMTQLTAQALFTDAFYVACHDSHALAARKTIDLTQLADEPLLLLEEGHCLREHALAACALEQTRMRSAFAASSLNTLVHMVAVNRGVTLLPKLAVDGHITDGLPITLLRARPEVAREIGMVWRTAAWRSEHYAQLAAVIGNAAG